jgi:hypothetical protein
MDLVIISPMDLNTSVITVDTIFGIDLMPSMILLARLLTKSFTTPGIFLNSSQLI